MVVENPKAIISISMPDPQLGELLLAGKYIGYHDDKYGVTSGHHQIVMKLSQHDDLFALFYLHLPYGYPIPDGIKETVKFALETTLGKSLFKIDFINSGTELEKNDIQFKM